MVFFNYFYNGNVVIYVNMLIIIYYGCFIDKVCNFDDLKWEFLIIFLYIKIYRGIRIE